MQDKIFRAWQFAHAKHSEVGQVRKYGGEPYITHPAAVANILIMYCKDVTPEMIMAALLHDVVEDTNTKLGEIITEFGVTVADYVYWLTDVAIPSDGNRATRMEINRNHIAQAPAAAQTIKAADSAHNIKGIAHADPGFGRKYVKEKRLLQKVLVKADASVLEYMDMVLEDAETYLNMKKD